MPTCLYCVETKDEGAFNREHVIPESFGTFEGNLVLSGMVCTACNSYFGRTLDLRLARESIEGLDRYEANLKQPDANTRFGKTPRLVARLNDGSFADGAEVYWGTSDDRSQLVLHLFPQFGVTNGIRTTWFRTEQLPQRGELANHGFQQDREVSVKCVGMDTDFAQGQLLTKGYSASAPIHVGGPRVDQQLDIRISGKIDRVLRRAGICQRA